VEQIAEAGGHAMSKTELCALLGGTIGIVVAVVDVVVNWMRFGPNPKGDGVHEIVGGLSEIVGFPFLAAVLGSVVRIFLDRRRPSPPQSRTR
jgi:hypothetical protein